MQRSTSTWIYFLSLLLAAGMTVALLPACGGGGGGAGCNTESVDEEEDGTNCELEEVTEEEFDGEIEIVQEAREDTGIAGEEAFIEILICEDIGCNEDG